MRGNSSLAALIIGRGLWDTLHIIRKFCGLNKEPQNSVGSFIFSWTALATSRQKDFTRWYMARYDPNDPFVCIYIYIYIHTYIHTVADPKWSIEASAWLDELAIEGADQASDLPLRQKRVKQ